MTNNYTILDSEEFNDFFVGEGQVSGFLYTVKFESETRSEIQKYFVRTDQDVETVLTSALEVIFDE